MFNKRWKSKELSFLRENYQSKGTTFCSNALNRTVEAVRSKAYAYSLTLPYVPPVLSDPSNNKFCPACRKELPKTNVGKILRRALREPVAP